MYVRPYPFLSHTPCHLNPPSRSIADRLLQSMRLAGMTPTPSGYGVVMAACHRAGQGERVLALLEVRRMCVFGTAKAVKCVFRSPYPIVIPHTYAYTHDKQEMDQSGVEPPATAYATAVHAALAAKEHGRMLQVG